MASSLCFYWLNLKFHLEQFFNFFGFCLCLFFKMNSHLLKLFDLSFDRGVELMVSLASPTTSYRFFFRICAFYSLCFFKWIVISLHCSFSVSTMVSSMWFSWLRQQRLLVFFFYFLLLTLFVLWSNPVSIMASSLCFYWLHQKRHLVQFFSIFWFLPLFFLMNSRLLKLFALSFDHGAKLMVSLASPTTSSCLFFWICGFWFCLFLLKWIFIYLHCSTSVMIIALKLGFLWPRQQRLLVDFFGLCCFWLSLVLNE